MEIQDYEKMILDGHRFYIDLKRRTLRIDGKIVMSGEDTITMRIDGLFVLDAIEWLYSQYKHSVPSERSESHRKCYFRALPESKLTDEDMMYGEERELARFRLEFFILRAIISGKLKWNDEWGNWFWQSQHDKDLVIIREWVEQDNNN